MRSTSVLLRSALVRVAFVAVLAFIATVATVAHAAPPPTTAHLSSALFAPQRNEDGLAWRARFIVSPETATEIDDGGAVTIRFALPLAPDAQLEPRAGLTPIVEEGEVVGVTATQAALRSREISLTVQQHLGASAKSLVLAAPLAAGTALQIIDGDLGSGTVLEVEPNAVLERHVGFMAPAGTVLAAREEAMRLTGYQERVSGAAIYARGDDVRATQGLHATLETPRDRGKPGVIGAALAFGGVVVALLIAVSRLRHSANVERADALLAAEVDALEQPREQRF